MFNYFLNLKQHTTDLILWTHTFLYLSFSLYLSILLWLFPSSFTSDHIVLNHGDVSPDPSVEARLSLRFGLCRPYPLTQRQRGGIVEGLELCLQIHWGTVRALWALGNDLHWRVLLIEPGPLDVSFLLGVCSVWEKFTTEVRDSFDSLVFKRSNMATWLRVRGLNEILGDLLCCRFGLFAEKSLISCGKVALAMVRCVFV